MAETDVSTPRGLKGFGSDDEKFLRFFSIVQDTASKMGCVFFCWAGEGNEFETDRLDGENLSGWLVPNEFADDFEAQWAAQWEENSSPIDDRFDKYDVFAVWSVDGSGALTIHFEP